MEELKIIGTRKECFKDTMSLIGKYSRFKSVVGYKVEDNNLLFYWHRDTEKCTNPFPYDMTLEQAAEFAWGWLLNSMPDCEEPDVYGSVVKGWSLESSDMCYKPKDSYCHESFCFVKITPIWIEYGK